MRPLVIAAALSIAGPLCAQTAPNAPPPAAPSAAPAEPLPVAVAPAVVPVESVQAVSAPAPVAVTDDPRIGEAQALVQEFGATLKGDLETAIKSGGPVAAIAVCKERAPAIAAELSARSGWEVARVSLKPRNAQAGQPDAWEQRVLLGFDTRAAAGEPAESLAVTEVVTQGGGRQFRYMKAIPTAQVCLACHGSDLSPEVAAALDQAYPDDRARGYAVGDIRGAFSLARPLD